MNSWINNSLKHTRSTPLACMALIFGLCASASAQAPRDWAKPLEGDKKIAHVLNRLGFGPRPGDAQRVHGHLHNQSALQTEHDHDGKKQGDQSDGRNHRNVAVPLPLQSLLDTFKTDRGAA